MPERQPPPEEDLHRAWRGRRAQGIRRTPGKGRIQEDGDSDVQRKRGTCIVNSL